MKKLDRYTLVGRLVFKTIIATTFLLTLGKYLGALSLSWGWVFAPLWGPLVVVDMFVIYAFFYFTFKSKK